MSYVEDNLMDGERVIHWGAIHWITFLPSITGFLTAFILIYARQAISTFFLPNPEEAKFLALLSIVISLMILFPSFISFFKAFLYKISTELAITNFRVIAKFGLVKRMTVELKHTKVESLNVDQGILDRILNSGTIIVNGSGSIQVPIPKIDSPMAFRNKAMEAINSVENRKTNQVNEAIVGLSVTDNRSKPEDKEATNYKINSIAIAKDPFLSKNKFYSFLLKTLFNADKYNKGEYIQEGYFVNYVYYRGDLIFSSCDSDLAVNIWSRGSQQAINRLEGSSKESYTTTLLCVSPDGKHVAFGNLAEQYYSYKFKPCPT